MLFLFSFLLLNLSETQQQNATFNLQVKQFYQTQAAKELFLADYPNLEVKSGDWYFNLGKINFKEKNRELRINVYIEDKYYLFTEVLK